MTTRPSKILQGYTLGHAANRCVRSLVNPWLVKLTRSKAYDIRNTIVVAGAPRSGTTWLAEALASIPRSAILFEPLHPHRVAAAKRAGFAPAPLFQTDEQYAPYEKFVERILVGRMVNGWTLHCNPIHRAVRPQVWIVKFVRANHILGWLATRFPVRKPVFIIRHPCATVASQLEQEWSANPNRLGQRSVLRTLPHLRDVVDELRNPAEVFAARWCIKNYVPLSLVNRPFHLVTYEGMITRGIAELEPVFSQWGVDVPARLHERLLHASSTTKSAAQNTQASPIDRWRKKLTPEQISGVLRVVAAFGMDFYTDDSEPDYSRLASSAPLSSQSSEVHRTVS